MTRVFDARPDSMDFRDEMFIPTLVDVPAQRPREEFEALELPVLDQGQEGACTGFALATTVHYLLKTVSASQWSGNQVSARMLYVVAKRYDEWPGTDYEGSSARGAMKGWHKHGVCSRRQWANKPKTKSSDRLTTKRAQDAAKVPLGAYFRVNHKNLVAMHAAISEVGVLFATSLVHEGWDSPGEDGHIENGETILGGHAFVIVGYDTDGFWIQNSWGPKWGAKGFGHVTYSDWLTNGMDVWVARLGVPVRVDKGALSTGRRRGAETSRYAFSDLKNHIISVGNDGALRESGQFGTSEADLEELFSHDLPRATSGWKKPRLLVYAHGGLVSEKSAIETIESNLPQLLGNEIYPLCFVWKTDFWSTLKNVLRDALNKRKSEGLIDSTKDFMLDRLDDALEPLARVLGGKMLWSEMKENALRATTYDKGAGRIVAEYLAGHLESSDASLHLVAHSAGSILLAPFAQLISSPKSGVESGPMKDYVGFGRDIDTCHLWAPACTVDLFRDTYLPLALGESIKRLSLYALSDEAERDDNCAHIYHKSLLYLVSNAFEDKHRIPLIRPDGEPILGMQKFVEEDADLAEAIANETIQLVLSPNQTPTEQCDAARAAHHGDFDNDVAVRLSTLNDILGECLIGPSRHPIQVSQSSHDFRDAMNRELAAID